MNLTTMTSKELYQAAYDNILEKWSREWDYYREAVKEGREAPIAKHRLEKLDAQLDELQAIILELEK